MSSWSTISLQMNHESIGIGRLQALSTECLEVGLVPIYHFSSFNGHAFPLALHPIGENTLGMSWGLGLFFCQFFQMEGLVTILSRVQMVDTGWVTGKRHMCQARIGILFEELKTREERENEKIRPRIYYSLSEPRTPPTLASCGFHTLVILCKWSSDSNRGMDRGGCRTIWCESKFQPAVKFSIAWRAEFSIPFCQHKYWGLHEMVPSSCEWNIQSQY